MMKQRFRTTSFWLGLSGAIVIILETISDIFGIELYSQEIHTIIISICSALILLGFVTKRNINDIEDVKQEDLMNEIQKKNKND